jgi:acyl-CoA synthetase (NDP forming)
MSNETRPPVDPDGLREIVDQRRKPIAFYSYTQPSPFGLRALASAGCAPFTGAGAMAAALSALAAPHPVPEAAVADTAKVALPGEAGPMSEVRAKALLREIGVPVPAGILVEGELPAVEIAFPAVAKVQSPDILHKTEIGGVRLNIADREELAAACAELAETARGTARFEGVLVEAMAGPGVEIIVGCVRDSTFGPVLTVGLGGTIVELFGDVSRRLAPVSPGEARAMLAELRSFPLLAGFRGSPEMDIDAAARVIATVSAFAAANERIAEIEINPLRVHKAGEGCTALDALIVLGRV